MKLNYVAPENLHSVWPVVGPLLDDALALSDCQDYTSEHLKVFILRSEHDLIVVVDDDQKIEGVATICYENQPLRRIAVVSAVSGRLISSPDTWEQLATFIRYRGATAVRGFARESVARLWRRYGFEERCRIVEVTL